MMCENYNNLAMTRMAIATIASIITIMILISTTTATSSSKQIPKFTLIEVNPSALDVMIHAFDHVLIYFHNQQNSQSLDHTLKEYQATIKQLKELYPNDHTLFGYLNRTNDFNGLLARFDPENGFKLINTFHTLNYDDKQGLAQFYSDNVHPKLPLIYRSDLKKQAQSSVFNLLFQYASLEDLGLFNKVYEKIRHFVVDFDTRCFAIAESGKQKSSISLYKGDKLIGSYSFYNRTQKEVADELIQSVNIDTLPTLINLDDRNFHRVFGGSVSDQLILIQRPTDYLSSTILPYRIEYEKAAESNRYEGLAYERVLFTVVDTSFFSSNFNEDVDALFHNTSSNYVIYLTKTDYDRFQLKKYRFAPSSQEWTHKQLLQFIEDVRLKRLDPEYKSEPVPTQQQQDKRVLRKIVGSSFISQVYEKPDQSIIVLFVDSKDEHSYSKIKTVLEQFTLKYKKQMGNELVTAIFDLHKNEHKLLYLKEAPQLIVFDKSNKKQTKYIKISQDLTLDRLTSQIRKAVTTVNLPQENDL